MLEFQQQLKSVCTGNLHSFCTQYNSHLYISYDILFTVYSIRTQGNSAIQKISKNAGLLWQINVSYNKLSDNSAARHIVLLCINMHNSR